MVNSGNQLWLSFLVCQALPWPRAPQTFNGNTWPHIKLNKARCACLTWLIHRSLHSVTVPVNMNEDKRLEMVLLKNIFHSCNYRYGPDFIPRREIFSQLTPLGKYPLVNKRRILLQTGELWVISTASFVFISLPFAISPICQVMTLQSNLFFFPL